MSDSPPRRVQLSRRKGWRMPENTVSVARPGRFGNPWTVAGALAAGYSDKAAIASSCVRLFREWVTDTPGSLTRHLRDGEMLRVRLLQGIPALRGKNLACWCALADQHGEPVPCHADVLLELANTPICEGVTDV